MLFLSVGALRAPPGLERLHAPWPCRPPVSPTPAPPPCLPSPTSWPSLGPALCLSRCPGRGLPWWEWDKPWSPGQALSSHGASTLPSRRGLGRSAACCSVSVRQTHGMASVSFSAPCETMLAQTRAPSTCSHSLSPDRERHTVNTALLLH